MTDKTKVLILYFSIVILSIIMFSMDKMAQMGSICVYFILAFLVSTEIVEYFTKKDPES